MIAPLSGNSPRVQGGGAGLKGRPRATDERAMRTLHLHFTPSRGAKMIAGALVSLSLLAAGGAVQVAGASSGRAHLLAGPTHMRSSRTRSAKPGTRPYVPVQVLADDGAEPLPVVDARVSILPIRGAGRPIAVGRTYSRGLALVQALPGRRIPGEFLVRVTRGFINGRYFRGTLYAREDDHHAGKPQSVIVNLATTLAAMYCRRHPQLSTTACERRTSYFLGLNRFGAGGDLSTHLVGDRALDGRMLLRAAARAGGLRRYLPKLVTQMSGTHARPTRVFHEGPRHVVVFPSPGRRRSRARGAIAHTAGLTGFLTESPEFFAKLLSYGSAVKNGVSFIKGMTEIISLVSGTSHKTAEALQEIKSSISQMEASLAVMHEQLKNLEEEVKSFSTEARHSEYSQLAAATANNVNAIKNNLSSFEAVVKAAAQITCGDYEPGANLQDASCAQPRSPAERCTNEAESQNPELRAACIRLGDLPLPARQRFYTENAPRAARESLIGNFIIHMSSEDELNDNDVESLANAVAGGLAGGSSEAEGVWQADSAWLVGEHRFIDGAVDQKLQNVVRYYMSAYVAGMVMRAYYYGFNQIPATTSESAEELLLKDFKDLVSAAPSPVPEGTFLDSSTGLMWSGQLGSVANQNAYSQLVGAGASITLPAQESAPGTPNDAPNAPKPELFNEEVIKDWSSATNPQLESLMKGTSLHFLTSEGLFAGQILSNSSSSWIHAEWPAGMGVSSQSEAGDTLYGFYVCEGGLEGSGSGCLAPVWAQGEALEMFDLRSGEGLQSRLHVSGTNNWWGSVAFYGGEEPNEAEEETPLVIPSVMSEVSLPVLYWREPPSTGSEAECYYYDSAGGGCKA